MDYWSVLLTDLPAVLFVEFSLRPQWIRRCSLFKYFPLPPLNQSVFFFLPSGKSARSSLTCSLRIAHLWETLGRHPSWSLESKAAWLTSVSSLMALALRPSVQPWPRFRTTWTRRSNKWTRCTWALVVTPRDPQTVEANLPTKWTSTGNESSKENPYELENPLPPPTWVP